MLHSFYLRLTKAGYLCQLSPHLKLLWSLFLRQQYAVEALYVEVVHPAVHPSVIHGLALISCDAISLYLLERFQ